jgi:hypothetical protein
VELWREKGYALVNGLLSSELVNLVEEEAKEKLLPLIDKNDFGSNGVMEYPTGMINCDKISLDRRITAAAAQLLGVSVVDIRLTQSDIWLKRGKAIQDKDVMNNNSQRIHCGKH